ncbi:MAG TPA: VWA domain-containing protein [Acidobacteriaceae bacterium]|jgi:VWFA-related protein|nr:VWA domain-containing protein [Acidobacteriaceae bacterium]
MFGLRLRRALLFSFLLSCDAAAQSLNIPPQSDAYGNMNPVDVMQASQLQFNMFLIDSRDPHRTDLQTPSGSVSKLDLKSPTKARQEYEQGYRLLMGNDPQDAVQHLAKSIALYPNFVAAHNALGSAYLSLGQNQLAHSEFTQAIALDDHLPNSYLNLGCAELALKQYPAAEESLRKASSIAPLDVQLQLALAYGEFVNHDYSAVIATASQVHDQKHEGAAMVHFFAAGAWEEQGNHSEAQHEMETLLQEDPKSASAGQFDQILEQIKAEQVPLSEATPNQPQKVTVASTVPAKSTAEEVARHAQQLLQQKNEESQTSEAEAAAQPVCVDCSATGTVESHRAPISGARLQQSSANDPAATFRVTVDEVTLLFAATDHGKSVTNLAASDVKIRDAAQPAGAILAFRNESQLPLRLGLVVDTSDSVNGRLSFEQAAATKFLQEVVVDKDDLAFVVGVSNSVLLVQDFSADRTLNSHALTQLAPGGGTALWDAVAFAADKLATHPEVQPVARILVVISDGEDNSSSTTLKQAIVRAQLGEVAVYTVSTREGLQEQPGAVVGDHALQTLSELTGGTAFMPGSANHLDTSLADLQQFIRGRYLVSYKPASFQPDGRYRTIDIEAQKDGRKLKIFARKGYYATAAPSASLNR